MADRTILDSEELIAAAEYFERAAAEAKDDDEASAEVDTATTLRRIAKMAVESPAVGPNGWPVVTIVVQGVGKGLRRG